MAHDMKWYTDVFPDLCKVYPKKRISIGSAAVEHFEIDRHGATMWLIQHRERVFEGRYVRLTINNETVMSDTYMERASNIGFARRANGRVLVAGLGLGMVLFPLMKKKEVFEVDVLESNMDVIRLVGPYVQHKKIHILHEDALEFKPPRSMKWDTIWFDIWPGRCADNLGDIAKLHHRFKYHVNRMNPAASMDSWYARQLRAERKAEAARGGLW